MVDVLAIETSILPLLMQLSPGLCWAFSIEGFTWTTSTSK
jgi:hypothetical protein